jgi:hypothetical protein
MPCSNPVRKKKRLSMVQSPRTTPVPRAKKPPSQFCCPRNHETPFFKVVRDHFDDSKHWMCEEHDEVAQRAAPRTGTVNLRKYIPSGIRQSMVTGDASKSL